MHLINDGFDIIELPEFLHEAINLTEVQRLDEISQLGWAKKVYPSASHTRKAHVIGTAMLALKIARHLKLPETELRTVVLAALFHDIGHGPMSHASEKIVTAITGLSHEDIGAKYITNELVLKKPDAGKIPELLVKYNVDKELIVALIAWNNKKFETTYPQKYHLKQIISSSIDVDRMDYLRRDAHTANVDIPFALQRLISYMRLADYRGKKIICFERTALRDIEGFFRSRMYMYNQVYTHPTVACMERMYTEALRYALETIKNKGVEFFMLNDVEIITLLERSSEVSREIVNILSYKRGEVYTVAYGLRADDTYPEQNTFIQYEKLLRWKKHNMESAMLGETAIETEIVKRANQILGGNTVKKHHVLVNFGFIPNNKEKAIAKHDVPILMEEGVVMLSDLVGKNRVVDSIVDIATSMPTKFLFVVYCKKDETIIKAVQQASKQMIEEL